MRTDIETIVVGAGHAGLAASGALAERGREHLVLEEGRVGQTWRADRWDSFRLNTPRWMSRLPGQTLDSGGRDGFDSGPEFADLLAAYVRERGLPLRQGVGRATVARAGDGGLLVRTAAEELRARNVILATGFQQLVAWPPLATSLPARLLQLDVRSYKGARRLPDGAVLVVGGGQSGCQIAEDLARAGRRVVLATSRVGWVPRRYRGRDALYWWIENGFFDVRRADVDDAAILSWRQPLVSGTAGGHSLSLPLLARLGVELRGRLEGADGETLRFADTVPAHIRFGEETAAKFRRSVDEYVADAGIDAPPATDDPVDEAGWPLDRPADGQAAAHEPRSGHPPRDLPLDRAGVATVIWCTGMRPRLDVLDLDVPMRGHAIDHVDGVTAVPGLYLIGAPWLCTRKSGIIWGVGADASRLAGLIAQSRPRPAPAPRSD
jgi:putative flavoprotein involved in K+ transport